MSLARFYYPEKGILVGKINNMSINIVSMRAYLNELSHHLFETEGSKILINDISDAGYVDAECRLMVGRFIKKYEQLTIQKVQALAYVVLSPAQQITIESIFKYKAPPIPYQIFTRIEKAIEWSKEFSAQSPAD